MISWNRFLHNRAGDKVVILQGCKVPVVLRPLDQGGYKLIGESYIDGMMYSRTRHVFHID